MRFEGGHDCGHESSYCFCISLQVSDAESEIIFAIKIDRRYGFCLY